MSHRIHVNARTTPKIREEIRQSSLPVKELMARYSISKATVLKWRQRTDLEDRSHRAHTVHTTLSSAQELLVCELRRSLLLPLDDLFEVTRRLINPQTSRSGIMRLLTREGLKLRATQRQEDVQRLCRWFCSHRHQILASTTY